MTFKLLPSAAATGKRCLQHFNHFESRITFHRSLWSSSFIGQKDLSSNIGNKKLNSEIQVEDQNSHQTVKKHTFILGKTAGYKIVINNL